MDTLLKKLNIEFNDAKKPQSLQTLNDLIEAAGYRGIGGSLGMIYSW